MKSSEKRIMLFIRFLIDPLVKSLKKEKINNQSSYEFTEKSSYLVPFE